MARLRYNLLESTLSADIDDTVTAIPLAFALNEGGVDIPTFAAPDTLTLRIGSEIMEATAYTTGDATITVTRGAEDTEAAEHFTGDPVKNVVTKEDFQASGAVFTITIAALDSSADAQARADFLCDGTGDQSTFQAAVDLIEGHTIPAGRIEVAPGTYDVTATTTLTTSVITIGGSNNVMYDEGFGATIKRSGVSNFAMFTLATGAALTLENILLHDPGDDANTSTMVEVGTSCRLNVNQALIINWQGTGSAIKATGNGAYVYVYNESLLDAPIAYEVTGGTLTSLKFRAEDSDMWGGPFAVNASPGGGFEMSVDHCYTEPIRVDGNTSNTPMPVVTISNNRISYNNDESIYITDTDFLLMTDNELKGNSGSAATLVRLGNISGGLISGNTLADPIQHISDHGIWVLDSDSLLIEGNAIWNAGSATDNTYSGIILDGNTNDCIVRGNMIATDGVNNLPLYGIRIDDSTCDNNLVEHNSLRTSCKTNGNEFSDAGTGTRGWEEKEIAFFAGNLAAGTASNRPIRFTRPAVLGLSYVNAVTAPTGSTAIFDVNKNGTTIYSTTGNRPTLAISGTSNTPTAFPNTLYMAANDVMTADTDQHGSSTPGANAVLLQRYMPI